MSIRLTTIELAFKTHRHAKDGIVGGLEDVQVMLQQLAPKHACAQLVMMR